MFNFLRLSSSEVQFTHSPSPLSYAAYIEGWQNAMPFIPNSAGLDNVTFVIETAN